MEGGEDGSRRARGVAVALGLLVAAASSLALMVPAATNLKRSGGKAGEGGQ
jgi:hypothetical protein